MEGRYIRAGFLIDYVVVSVYFYATRYDSYLTRLKYFSEITLILKLKR